MPGRQIDVDVLGVEEVKPHTREVGASFANYLDAPELAEPIEQFFGDAAGIPNLDAAILAIQSGEGSGRNLASYGVTDLSAHQLTRRSTITAFGDVVSRLNDSVIGSGKRIGTSYEYINSRGVPIESIVEGVRMGTLKSVCRVEMPPAACMAVVASGSDALCQQSGLRLSRLTQLPGILHFR